MESFDFIYAGMTKNYNDLEQVLDVVYQKTQNDPTDESNFELLQGLGKVGKNMIESQKEFVMEYGDPTNRETIIAGLNDKQQALINALGESLEKVK